MLVVVPVYGEAPYLGGDQPAYVAVFGHLSNYHPGPQKHYGGVGLPVALTVL